jgi:hypothetical protein
MGRAADVRSVEAIRVFRADLVAYQSKLRQAIETLGVELARGEDWFEQQKSYWPAESRRASDQLAEARAAYSRCLLGKGKERASACDDERKVMLDTMQRMSFAEQQIAVTKRWYLQVRHDADEFRNRISRLVALVDGEIPRALAALDQITASLDRYTQQTSTSTGALGNSRDVSGDARPEDNTTSE